MNQKHMFEAEIVFHQGTEREFTYEDLFATLNETVKYIESQTKGMDICRAWINNCEVRLLNGHVCDAEGERIVDSGKKLWIEEIICKQQEFT
jgi:hypothetical protein